MSDVRVRVAPSPTGYPHLGLVYQAMFDYVIAKKAGGKFILRIEDTDRGRFVEGAEDVIYNSLKWSGLLPDEGPREVGEVGPYRQSERLEIYQKHADLLLEKGHAYRCFCTKERLDEMRKQQEKNHQAPRYDRTCLLLSDEQVQDNLKKELPFVVRMKIPENTKIIVADAITGTIEFDSKEIDDQVILKADGYPTYHLAVVVDDHLMKISHVIRGTEWISSFPKHQLLYEYFGWKDSMPIFMHIPLLLNSEGGGKLSKRHGHTSVEYYQKEGFLPEAVLNYLANIVWNHPEGKEIFPLMDFAQAFDLEPFKTEIRSNGVKFDLQKLEWMNGEYIRQMSDQDLTQRLQDYLVDHPKKDLIAPVVPLIKERIKKLSDFIPLTDFLYAEPEYDMSVFNKIKIEDKVSVLEKIKSVLDGLGESWEKEQFETSLQDLAKSLEIHNRDFFQLLRAAVSGQLVSPPLFESMKILGENKSLERIEKAKDFIANPPQEPKY